jgi:hypothetical protein
VQILRPRYHQQYGFWEWVDEPAVQIGTTKKGNLICRPSDPISWLQTRVFDKKTGICLNKCYQKHVPEEYRRWKLVA